jgi:predicted neuraminidase
MNEAFRSSRFRYLTGAAIIVGVTLWAVWPNFSPRPPQRFAPPFPVHVAENEAPKLISTLINALEPFRVHAPAIAELPDGRLRAAWFAGSREGAIDVKIYGAEGRKDAQGDFIWGEQAVLAVGGGQWSRKLGNPIVFPVDSETDWMIFVSVSLGGWATSQLNLLVNAKAANGENSNSTRRLVTSPFFNLSTLVKGSPIFFADGNIGVPVYHELAGKFAELLVLAPSGEVKNKIRMDHGRRTLQPVILVEDATHAIALMRDTAQNPPRVWRNETEDGGLTWSEPKLTDLPNPNSALGAVRLADGRLIAVANDTEDERLRLSLLVSEDRGQHWRVIHRFEDRQSRFKQPMTEAEFRAQAMMDIAALNPINPTGIPDAQIVDKLVHALCRRANQCGWQYDYPYLIRAANGDFHLVYTWNRSFIRHVHFNTAWLRERLEAAQ